MVVIMHDDGGNRASTVVLTRKIIREGQSDGYKFMTTRVDTAGYWLQA
jgi:hypothetical protein